MNSKKYITKGDGLPNWSNPISHAVIANNMCFVSGQLSVNEDGVYVPGTTLEEARIAFDNFFAAVKNAGFDKEDIVFVDIAFDNLTDLPEINQLYTETFLEGRRPARTIYQVAALPFNGKIKIMGTCIKDN